MNSVISAFKTKKNANNNIANEKKQQQLNNSANCLEKQQQQQQTNQLSPKHNNQESTTTTTTSSSVMVISAVPTQSSASKKKATHSHTTTTATVAADNGYQYLRHIREIDTATKILSPIFMAADESNDMLNFSPTLTPTQTSTTPTIACSVDVVDNAIILPTAVLMDKTTADLNSNKAIPTTTTLITELFIDNGNNVEQQQQNKQQLEQEDDESEEHSAAACTSSSSEHSCSTVLRSPLSGVVGGNGVGYNMSHQAISPNKSLKLSLSTKTLSSSSSSPSLSCSSTISALSTTSPITTSLPSVSATVLSSSTSLSSSSSTSSLAICSPTAKMNNNSMPASPTSSIKSLSPTTTTTTTTPITTTTIANEADIDYVPAFLKPSPITLPIRLSKNGSVFCSMPPCLKPMSCSSNIGENSGHCTMTMNYNSATPKHTRSKPRLSLSRFLNHSMPSVHGRGLSLSIASDGNAYNSANSSANQPPKRMSTHQRNLSLDFRSMGILLPPVSQVTNTRINLTQHHRNRSLDSALQKIPEVEVLSPNAEQENTFCTPSILGTTMCSKIVTTAAANVTAALTTTTTPALTSTPQVVPATIKTEVQQTNNIVGVEPYPLRMRLLPTSTAVNSVVASVVNSNNTNTTGGSGSGSGGEGGGGGGTTKKREDLTSLGSDDSGIICGSESDQISLNRIRNSHESLDSGEMDAEEECMDMLETASMDEEYGMLQSDLCFYQTMDTDCRTLRKQRMITTTTTTTTTVTPTITTTTTNNNNNNIKNISNFNLRHKLNVNVAKNIEETVADANTVADVPTTTTTTPQTPQTPQSPPPLSSSSSLAEMKTPIPKNNDENSKNEVLFKNFFGATKNAIFRTAQSIIENHEKKNAAKAQNLECNDNNSLTNSTAANNANMLILEQIKSPIDVSKKKEFFSLLTSNSSKKAAAKTAKTPTPTQTPTTTTATTIVMPAAAAAVSVENEENVESHTKRDRILHLNLPSFSLKTNTIATTTTTTTNEEEFVGNISKSSSVNSLKMPGVVKCFIKETQTITPTISTLTTTQTLINDKTEKGPSGLLRFFESPVFNIHFAVHYLFYSKEPGVLSFIGNKIFSFPDQEVDLYIPQLIIMYIQMDELAEVLDPYLTIRCRKSVDFSLKCLWLLEAYNYQMDQSTAAVQRKPQLSLMREIYSKRERKILINKQDELKDSLLSTTTTPNMAVLSKKTHHRSQSDATVLMADNGILSMSNRLYQKPPYTTQTLPLSVAKLCLGDLTSGRAFDNGCTCFETVRGQVNGLLGQKTVCVCGAPKTAPQKEFMKALINVGKNLTSLNTKAEKTSALRMFLNLINKNLPARVWLPLYSDIPHHVVRITEEKTAVLNSKDKTPYIIYVEVVEVHDIYSSPIIPKMMPSLRHTKSEEHLEVTQCAHQNNNNNQYPNPNQNNNKCNTHASCSRTSSNCSSVHNATRRCYQQKAETNTVDFFNTNSSSSTDISANANGNASGTTNLTTSAADIVQVLSNLQLHEEDVWSQEDDEITAQYMHLRKLSERDAVSQMSLESYDSRDQGLPVMFNIGDVRTRHCNNLNCENTKSFSNDPEDPSAAALKEPWHEKVQQIRESSPYGHLSNWRLLSAIVKCGDDLRQELMATQLLQMFKIIWTEEKVDLWVRPYKIVCLSNDSGLIEPILNTVSLHQIKKNSNKSLRDYFIDEYGAPETERFCKAQRNFVQSCAAYCLISYLLQVKDRHNGNILLHSDGHIIHIDFGFILSISPKNLGFEQSPFKLTPEFVDVMGGTNSEHWKEFNRLLLVGMMSARKHMDRIINFVEIMRSNAQLPCFKNGCSTTVQNLRKRFHMNLTEQEMERKVETLVQDSLKSLSTKLYDGYQYYTNGIL